MIGTKEDPRAMAAAKSRAREKRHWLAYMATEQDHYLAEINALRRARNKYMKLAYSEAARANYWRGKARALKRELREARGFAVGCPVCGGTRPHEHEAEVEA